MRDSRNLRNSRALLIVALIAIFAVIGRLGIFRRPGAASFSTGVVEHVIDGDTVRLADGRHVRYIGMDSPEMNSTSERARAIAIRARDFNSSLVEGRTVRLEYDVETIDRYGRTLAYIWVNDTLVNGAVVREGLARARVYGRNTRYADRLARLEDAARAEGRGMWADR